MKTRRPLRERQLLSRPLRCGNVYTPVAGDSPRHPVKPRRAANGRRGEQKGQHVVAWRPVGVSGHNSAAAG